MQTVKMFEVIGCDSERLKKYAGKGENDWHYLFLLIFS